MEGQVIVGSREGAYHTRPLLTAVVSDNGPRVGDSAAAWARSPYTSPNHIRLTLHGQMLSPREGQTSVPWSSPKFRAEVKPARVKRIWNRFLNCSPNASPYLRVATQQRRLAS